MRRLLNLVGPFVATLLIAGAFTVSLTGQSTSPTQNASSNQGAPDDGIRVAAQPYTPPVAGTIVVQTNMVEVGVVVRDENGKVVTGLKKEDFQIFDSGKQQAVSHFNVEEANPPPTIAPAILNPNVPPPAPPPPPPRYIGFYFDDNNMKTSDLAVLRKAAHKFVSENLATTDKAAVFTSSTSVTQGFTDDKQKLAAAIDQITSHYRDPSFGAGACPRIEPYQAWQIMQTEGFHSLAFDLAYAQAVQCNCGDPPAPGSPPSPDYPDCMNQMKLIVQTRAGNILTMADNFSMQTLGILGDIIRYVAKMPGRRMLVMSSSGYFSMSDKVKKQQDKLVDDALHAGIRINTLDAKGLSPDWIGGDPSLGPPIVPMQGGTVNGFMQGFAEEMASDERDVSVDSMALLADGTGGTFFHNQNDLAGGVRQMAALPEVSYSLGFTPEQLKSDGAYHSLRVKLVNNKGYTIEARPGYFAPSKASLAPMERFARLNKEVMTVDELNGIQAKVETKPAVLATGEPALKVSVHVDTRTLPFKKENKLHIQRLIFITALFDSDNKFLSGVEALMEMNLDADNLAKLGASGANASFTLQAPPGNYRLRQVVQEVVTGRLAASNTPVEIH